ncbi:MAG: hypothetical protein ACRCT7_05930 [Shewanella sp.]
MKIITSLSQLSELSLAASTYQALIKLLTEPFEHDLEATQAAWDELAVRLYVIEKQDTDTSLAQEGEATLMLGL